MIKKIGIECHNLEGPRFGIGQTLIQLLEALSQTPNIAEKFEFYLYFKKEIPSDKILESPIFHKKIIRAPFFPPSFTLFYNFLIPLYYHIDSLHGFFFPSYMLPVLFGGKSAVVLTNDVYYEIHKGNLPMKYRLAYRFFSWWAARKADKLITISETAKKELIQYFKISNKKIEVVPWGLNKNLVNFFISGDEIMNIKKKFAIKKNFIFSWGQAFPRRHFKEAVLAFAQIANNFPDMQYLVACEDKYNPPILERLAKKVNRELGREAIIIRSYIDNQNDLFGLIKSARLAVYISENEAMGLPPIEALSLKTPPLIADNELAREIFNNSAFLIKNPNNIDEIAQALKNGITNSAARDKIIDHSQLILNKFSWAACSKRLIEIFNDIF